MIEQLHPSIQQKARDFLQLASEQGFNLRITHGFRTHEEQNELYAQGRTKPGPIVTNARGGESMHNFGLAFDVVDKEKGYNIDWDKLGDIGRSVGLEHGDRGMVDKPHFQHIGGLTLEQIQKGQRPMIVVPPAEPTKKRFMKIKSSNQRLVWVKRNDKTEFYVIRTNDGHPKETKHRVKKAIPATIMMFAVNEKYQRMNAKDIDGLTAGKDYSLKAVLHKKPELGEME
jgi:peptidoglycan L-alanyl-D-glutamate endopeptidase CwlK